MTKAVKQYVTDEIRPVNKLEPNLTRRGKPFFNPWRLAFLGILILAAIVYLPSLHGQKIWDDDGLLDGSAIGGGKSALNALTQPFLGAYFRPLVSLSFFIENKLWNGIPFYYHQTNILLHVAACAALMGFVLAAFNRRSLALLSGLLFAIQPAQVSTVAWIGGRTDSLCSLLVILFSYTLLLGIRSQGRARFAWLSLSVIAFFLAAVTKEQVVALILLVPFAAKAFAKPDFRPNAKTYIRLTTPFAIASAVFAILWFSFNSTPFSAISRGPLGQLMTAGQTTVFYSLLFIVPASKWMHTLSLGYLDAAGLPLTFAGVALLALLLTGVYICIKKNPQLGWFAAFVALALLPVINLVPLPSLLVAPYRAGVAGVGVAVLLAFALLSIPRKQFAYAVGALFVAWCTWLTYWGSTQWSDPVTIFGRITAEDPYSIVAHRNMANHLMKIGDAKHARDQMEGILTTLYGSSAWKNPQRAYEQFQNDTILRRRVIENQGNAVEPQEWMGQLFAQLGYAQAKLQDFKTSENSFDTAVAIDSKNVSAHQGLAEFEMFRHDWPKAEEHLRLAAAVRPGDPTLRTLLAECFVEDGQLDQAKESYQQAIDLEPWFGPAYQDLAEVQVKQHDVTGAIQTLKAALNCQVLNKDAVTARLTQLQTQLSGAKS